MNESLTWTRIQKTALINELFHSKLHMTSVVGRPHPTVNSLIVQCQLRSHRWPEFVNWGLLEGGRFKPCHWPGFTLLLLLAGVKVQENWRSQSIGPKRLFNQLWTIVFCLPVTTYTRTVPISLAGWRLTTNAHRNGGIPIYKNKYYKNFPIGSEMFIALWSAVDNICIEFEIVQREF